MKGCVSTLSRGYSLQKSRFSEASRLFNYWIPFRSLRISFRKMSLHYKQKARAIGLLCYFILRVLKDLSKSSFFSFGTLSYPILTSPILISFQNSDLLFTPDNSKVSGKTATLWASTNVTR